MGLIPFEITATYEKSLLSWVREKWSQGLTTLKKERAFVETPRCIEYVDGIQNALRPASLSRVTDNKIKKIVLDIVSSFTDVRFIWNYITSNKDYKAQADILNKLARGWWKNSLADRRLQSTLTFSAVGGSGYAAAVWNASLPGGGDIELIPYDPRDVVPIDPIYSDSIQDWQGVILRRRMPLGAVRNMYPAKAHLIQEGSTAAMSGYEDRAGKSVDVFSTMWNMIRGGSSGKDGEILPNTTDLLHIFVKDYSLNTGSEVKLMGDPDSNYAYKVHPIGSVMENGELATAEDARLYPRGRLIICTPNAILHDGPNPYWHGMFPVVRFTLDALPWSLLGSAIVGDLVPLQDGLNTLLRGIEDGLKQWLRRGVIADKNSISRQNLEVLDTRKEGFKVSLNPVAGDGFKMVDGPNFPNWLMDMLPAYKTEMEENSGVRGLQQLAQMKNAAMNSDTLDKYMDALSPALRLRARSIEVSLSELAEMLKVDFFQYYDTERRLQILGKDGVTLEDFDYDPGNMIPSSLGGEEGEREARASKFHRNFTFSIAPNSFLNVSHMQQKLMTMQLFRANGIDIWTLWEDMDVPNIGEPPKSTVPERMIEARRMGLQPGPTPEVVKAQERLTLAQADAAVAQIEMQKQQMAQAAQQGGIMEMLQKAMGGKGGDEGAPPPGGAPPQAEAVRTNGVGPQGGRPPSGQAPPQIIMKDGGTRAVISESGS